MSLPGRVSGCLPHTALDNELTVASQLALRAGSVLRNYHLRSSDITRKSHGELVTQADFESDRIIRDGLAVAFPEDGISTEESLPTWLGSRRVWIVDPLDATSDFVAQGTCYSVSIGLAIEGRPVLGVVYNPERDELFAGTLLHGVVLNGTRCEVTQINALAKARIVVSRKEWERGLKRYASFAQITPMASFAYKLARVSAGLEDGAFSLAPRKGWGTCAGIALVRAGKGVVTTAAGLPLSLNDPSQPGAKGMVAAGPVLHPQLLNALGELPAEIFARLARRKTSLPGDARKQRGYSLR